MRTGLVGFVLLLLLSSGAARAADAVDLQLILAADVSRSIDEEEFKLQREGYAAALKDPRVLGAIQGGAAHAIAVTFVEWAGAGEQQVVVGWTAIHDDEGAAVIADQILKAPRSFVGHTSISDAILFSIKHFDAAGGAAPRRVIDISGDGTNNSGEPVELARDMAVAAGYTVNGLAIINLNPNFGYVAHVQPPGGLPKYYHDNVIGGPGAFVLKIDDFHSFAEAMVQKLITEIAGSRLDRWRDYAER